MLIENGGGGQQSWAKVDTNNRLHTETVSREVLTEAVFKGEAFNFNTGAITLTTGNESALGYLAYNGDVPFVVTEILFIIGAATGTLSTEGIAKIYRNPTGGTIVSGAVPVETAANRDFSSSITVTGDMFKGAEGNTLTGGTVFADTSRGSSFSGVISFDAAPILLRKGNTLGVSWEPPTGNTSQVVKIAATGYISGSDVFQD
jgi:hypothetical protein